MKLVVQLCHIVLYRLEYKWLQIVDFQYCLHGLLGGRGQGWFPGIQVWMEMTSTKLSALLLGKNLVGILN